MALFAGAAARDISPAKPLQLYGYPHVKRIWEKIHDPLLASAVYFENEGSSVVLVALDILMLEPPTARDLRRRIASVIDCPESGVFISCSHTHSGPVTSGLVGWAGNEAMTGVDAEYLEQVFNGSIEAATAAKATARPAEYGWTTADGRGVGGNRLGQDGAIDPEVGVIALRDAESRSLFAMAMLYGMHPTVMHEDTPEVSSDFPHYTREHLREAFGEELVIAYHNGPCGNQSPRYHVKGQTFDEAERLGRKLGEAVRQSVAALGDDDFSGEPLINSALREFTPVRRELPTVASAEETLAEYRETYERLQREAAGHGPIRTAECAIFGAEGSLALAKAAAAGAVDAKLANYPPFELQGVRIGEVRLVGWPGECFVEYALELKRRAGCKVFISAFVNGEMQGYIVTPDAAQAGGYEATNALFGPGTGAVFVRDSLDMLRDL